MKMPTLAQFKKFSKANKPLAEAVCMAKAFAQVERERVDAYVLPIFSEYTFYNDLEVEHGAERERITELRYLYLSNDEVMVADYFAACDYAHKQHGFTGPSGHCPALTAERLQLEAEQCLIKAGCEFMGISDDRVLYGTEREKMLDLLLGACLK